MKKKLFVLLLGFSLLGAVDSVWSQAATKSLTLDIKGMTCAMCGAKVENTIKKVDGVSKCAVDDKTGKASVEYTDGKATPDQILEACNKTGFKCSL